MKVKSQVVYGELPGELTWALDKLLNEIGWENVLNISYSQGDIKAYSRYSALVVYKA